MKKHIAIVALLLAFSLCADAMIYTVDTSTLSTQNLTNSGFMTITNAGITNQFYQNHVTNRNYGDSPSVAFGKVNSNFTYLASLVASNLGGVTNLTLNGVVGGLSGNNLFTTAGTNAILAMVGVVTNGGSSGSNYILKAYGTGNDLNITNSFTLTSTNQIVVASIYDAWSNEWFYPDSSMFQFYVSTSTSTNNGTNAFWLNNGYSYLIGSYFDGWAKYAISNQANVSGFSFDLVQNVDTSNFWTLTVSTAPDLYSFNPVLATYSKYGASTHITGRCSPTNTEAIYFDLRQNNFTYSGTPSFTITNVVFYTNNPQMDWAAYTNGNWSFYSATNVSFNPVSGLPTVTGTLTNYANIYGTPYIGTNERLSPSWSWTATNSQGNADVFILTNAYGSPFGSNQYVVLGVTNYNTLTVNGSPIGFGSGIGITNVIGDQTNGISGGTIHVATNNTFYSFQNTNTQAGTVSFGSIVSPGGGFFTTNGFSGVGVSMMNSNALYLPNSSNIPLNHAVSMWFKYNRYDVPDGSYMGLLGRGNSGSGNGEDVILNPPTTFDVYPVSGPPQTSPTNYSDNNWHNMTLIWTNNVEVGFIDGNSIKSGSVSGKTVDQSYPFMIGHMECVPTYAQTYFKGMIDEVKVWDCTYPSNTPSVNGLFTNWSAYTPNIYYWNFNNSNLVDSIQGAVLQVTNWNSFVTSSVPSSVFVGTSCVPYWVSNGYYATYTTNLSTNTTSTGTLGSNLLEGFHFDSNLNGWVGGEWSTGTAGTYAAGVASNAFDSTGGVVHLGTANAPVFNSVSNFCISFWTILNRNSYPANMDCVKLWYSSSPLLSIWSQYYYPGGYNIYWSIAGDNGAHTISSTQFWLFNYTNGVLSVFTDASGVPSFVTTNNYSFGDASLKINTFASQYIYPSTYNYMDFYIDELNVWTRTLATNEVAMVYSNKALPSFTFTSTNTVTNWVPSSTTNAGPITLGSLAFQSNAVPSLNGISNAPISILAGSGMSVVTSGGNITVISTPNPLTNTTDSAGVINPGGTGIGTNLTAYATPAITNLLPSGIWTLGTASQSNATAFDAAGYADSLTNRVQLAAQVATSNGLSANFVGTQTSTLSVSNATATNVFCAALVGNQFLTVFSNVQPANVMTTLSNAFLAGIIRTNQVVAMQTNYPSSPGEMVFFSLNALTNSQLANLRCGTISSSLSGTWNGGSLNGNATGSSSTVGTIACTNGTFTNVASVTHYFMTNTSPLSTNFDIPSFTFTNIPFVFGTNDANGTAIYLRKWTASTMGVVNINAGLGTFTNINSVGIASTATNTFTATVTGWTNTYGAACIASFQSATNLMKFNAQMTNCWAVPQTFSNLTEILIQSGGAFTNTSGQANILSIQKW